MNWYTRNFDPKNLKVLLANKYENGRRVAAYTQVRKCVHIIFTKEREGERERESYSVIRGNRIYHLALSVFKIILCRIVPIQFLLIMFKIFY